MIKTQVSFIHRNRKFKSGLIPRKQTFSSRSLSGSRSWQHRKIEQTGLLIIDADFNICGMNSTMQDIFKGSIRRKCYRYFLGQNQPCTDCAAIIGIATQQPFSSIKCFSTRKNRTFQVTGVPYQNEKAEWRVSLRLEKISKAKLPTVTLGNDIKKQPDDFPGKIDESVFQERVLKNVGKLIIQDGQVKKVNSSLIRLTGYTGPEILAWKPDEFEEIIHPADIETLKYALEKETAKSDFVFRCYCRLITKSKRIKWVSVITQIVTFGQTTAESMLIVDVNWQKQRESELRLSEIKYKDLFKNNRDAICIVEIEGNFIDCNQTFANMLGYSRAEIMGKTLYDLTPVKWRAWQRTEIINNQLLSKGFSELFEKEYIRKDGARFPVEIRAYLMRDLSGQPTTICAFARDITERKISQQNAIHAARLASVGELAAGLAHEINNPINGIINYAQLTHDKGGLSGTLQHYLQRIMEEGQRIADIIQNLLTFAHPGQGKLTPTNLEDIFQKSISLFAKTILNDAILMEINFSADLPKVMCQPQMIQQVFVNILVNAWYALNEKYPDPDPNKRLEITATLSTVAEKQFVQISFTDHGTGIPEENINQLYKPFFTSKPPSKGTGLGLAISYSIIEDHGGRILIDSQEGFFTRITVGLPVG